VRPAYISIRILQGQTLLLACLHSVGGQYCFALWHLSSSVIICNTPWRRICNVTYQGAACDGGPVVLRPVRATPCLLWNGQKYCTIVATFMLLLINVAVVMWQLDVVIDNFGRSMLWSRLWEVSCLCCYVQKAYEDCHLIWVILFTLGVSFVNYDYVQCISIHNVTIYIVGQSLTVGFIFSILRMLIVFV